MRLFRVAVGSVVAAAIAATACVTEQRDIAAVVDAGPPVSFVDQDASQDAALDAESVAMCPVTTCTFPSATCPSSRFPCDVDLRNDNENCGGCGIRCGGDNVNNSQWTCVEGQCVFGCTGGWGDCDDNPTNGCEVRVSSDTSNCGSCGRKCGELEECQNGGCIDLCKAQGLPDRCPGICTNLKSDDDNCGTCGTVCDKRPGPGTQTYLGCVEGKCDRPKCNPFWADCNGDPKDGCEASLSTNDNCGRCGVACTGGNTCGVDPSTQTLRWICDEGETLCDSIFYNRCMRLDEDPLSCGRCGYVCPGYGRPHFVATCAMGVCDGKCENGYADCDGISETGCETDTHIDNRNCGSCGNACAPNQVCSAGECLVAPCDSEGPIAK